MQKAKDFYPGIFKDVLVNEVKRRLFEEGIPRIRHCLALLSEEEIWYATNEHTNSVGVLVLHLCGNVRQWILSGLGGQPDLRRRDQEFAPVEKPHSGALIEMLETMREEVEMVLDNLPPHILLEPMTIQGFEENGISVLVHVTEHFSYHVGQITQTAKMLKNVDTGYYSGLDLN